MRSFRRSPEAVKQYLQMHIGSRPHEVFAVLFLDVQHRLLTLEELFRGTLTQTLRAALALVDVRVLDHVIVSPGQSFSMAERGLL